MKTIDKFCDRFADKLIWVGICVYVILFAYICSLRYYSFSYYDWDFASDIIVLWNSIHGKMFYYPFLEQTIFGAHLYLVIVFLMPIYAIFQHPLTLLFLQSLFLGLSAYPLFLLAKSQLNKTFALVISLAYLLYPPLGYTNLFETHFEIYAVFFLFFSLYFFEKKDFKKFLMFIFLSIICKENVSLLVFMFGIYALLRKRSQKWILAPSLLGIIWFLLAIKIVIPYFAKDVKLYQEGFIFSIFYRHLGRNLFEIVKTIVSHPIATAKFAFTPEKILYLFKLFIPTGFIGFLNPAVLLVALPIFMQNLLSSAWPHTQINYHYAALLIPFVFSSVIFGFKRSLSYKPVYAYRHTLLFAFLIVAIASGIYLKAPQLHFVKYLKTYKATDLVNGKEQLIRMIPEKASVISTFQFLPRLANRYDLYSMHFVVTGFKMYTNAAYEPPQNLEYALIDFNEPLILKSFFSSDASSNIRSFLENGGWGVLKAIDDIVLFKKGYQAEYKLFDIVQDPRIDNVVNANIDNQLMFLGYDVLEEDKEKDGILHLVYYWKRIGKVTDPLGFFMEVFDTEGNINFVKEYAFGYRVYVPESWPKDRIIKLHRYVLIPSDVKKGIYSMEVGLYNLSDRNILPISRGSKIDKFGRIPLGNISIIKKE